MAYEFVEEDVSKPSFTEKVGGIQKELVRHGARTAKQLGTRAIGLPGDIFSLINEYIARPAAKGLGQKDVPYEETVLGKVIPTTESHRKGIEDISGDYLKPKNKIEEFTDDVFEDAALLLIPGGKQAKAIQKTSGAARSAKSLAKSLGANLAGEVAGEATGREDVKNLVKMGSLFTASILDQPKVAKQVAGLYDTARSNLPEGASIGSRGLEKRLNNLEKLVTGGRPIGSLSEDKKFVLDQIDKVRPLIKDGKVDISQLWDQKIDLNKDLSKLYALPGKSTQKSAKNLSKKVTQAINDTIKDYGETNPSFYKPFKDADQAFGVISRSNLLQGWAEKSLKFTPVSAGLVHLIGIPGLTEAATYAASAALPYQAGKVMYRVSKSPALAKIYGNIINSALKEDSVAFNKYMKDLDERLLEQEAKDRYEFID